MYAERAHGLSKRIFLVFFGLTAAVLICLTGCASTLYQSSSNLQADVDDVQYLSSYGEWVQAPSYGMVWRPDVVSGWGPFYYGHWIWTSNGWAWTSYEPYGWLVFHYGFWGYEPGLGWFWVPGNTWYPARVQWYTFGNYTAWAPIPPPGVVWPDPWDPYDYNVWIVVDVDDLTNEYIGRHRVERPVYREIVNRRTIVKRAPGVREVEKVTRKKMPVVKVREKPVNVRARTASVPPASGQSGDTKLKKMVLPKVEKRRVEKHASEVEREVLIRRKVQTAPAKKTTEKSTKKSREKKSREKKSDTSKRKNR